MPIFARSKLRFQVAPVVGSERFAIVPRVLRMVILDRIGDDQGKRATDDCREGMVNLHRTSGKATSANDSSSAPPGVTPVQSLPFTLVTTTVGGIAFRPNLLFIEVVVLVVLRTLQRQLER